MKTYSKAILIENPLKCPITRFDRFLVSRHSKNGVLK